MHTHLKLTLPLREEPFFRAMSPAVIAQIENYVYYREYEPRQIVYFPDDICDHVYWVREGRVKVKRVAGDGHELTFRHLLPGDIFGEECLVATGKRGAYAEAMTNAVLCLMRADDFRRMAREEVEVSLMLAKSLCGRTMDVEQVLSATIFDTVRSRVAAGLLRLHQKAPKSDGGRLPVTHQELGCLVGATRETTTGVLHGLSQEGIVRIANRNITVVDPVALEHAARSG